METDSDPKRILSRFKSDKGEILPGGLLDLPVDIKVDQLQVIVNTLLQLQDEPVPLAFFVDDNQIVDSLESCVQGKEASEDVVEIVYQPQAVFQVRAVTRCTGTLEGNYQLITVTDVQYL